MLRDGYKRELGQTLLSKKLHNARNYLCHHTRDIVKEQKEKSAHDLWFREQVQLGINSANADDIISSEEIEAEAKEWYLKTESKQDKSTL